MHGKWRILNASKNDTIIDDMNEGRESKKKKTIKYTLPTLTNKRTNKMKKSKR